MPLFHNWSTNTPAHQDTPGVEQPVLVNDSAPGAHDGDMLLASQLNIVATKLHNVYQEVGTLDNDPPTCLRVRVSTLEGDVSSLDGRVTATEGDITSLDGRVTSLEGRVTALENLLPLYGTLTTTDANPTPITHLALDDHTAVWLEASVVGRTTTHRLSARVLACAHREGASATLDHSFLEYYYASDPSWHVDFLASGVDIVLQVTGAVGLTINWSATVRYQEAA